MDIQSLKSVALAAIESRVSELNSLGVQIWENPELNYEEYKAHDLLTSFLEGSGFSVERSYKSLETSFRAIFGSGRPNICIVCEYDALPEMGHACGHHLIAEASVAAGLGVKAGLEACPGLEGRVTVLGTPAEEGGGGKILLMKSGAFEDVDLAMLAHPAPAAVVRPLYNAVKELHVTYRAKPPRSVASYGKSAHSAGMCGKTALSADKPADKSADSAGYRKSSHSADTCSYGKSSHSATGYGEPAVFPCDGENALDAAVMAYNAVAVLRQQMRPAWRCHVIILDGGTNPYVIPTVSVLACYIKAPDADELCTLESGVLRCFNSASMTTGCSVEVKQMNYVHRDIKHNKVLAGKFAENYKRLGAEFADEAEMYGSTDMIRISEVVPTLYPSFAVGSGAEVNHSMEFLRVSNLPEAHASALLAAKAVAHTCLDVLLTEELWGEVRESFNVQIEN